MNKITTWLAVALIATPASAAEEKPAVNLTVKPAAATRGKQTEWVTDYGSSEHSYARQRVYNIEVKNLRTRPEALSLEAAGTALRWRGGEWLGMLGIDGNGPDLLGIGGNCRLFGRETEGR